MSDRCVFCDLIDHGTAAQVSWFGRYYWADPMTTVVVSLAPLRPVTEGHVLVVPVDHIPDALEDPLVTADVFRVAAHVAAGLRARTGCDVNLITSAGPAATQTIMHLHVHVVPRRPGDGLRLPWTKDADVRPEPGNHS